MPRTMEEIRAAAKAGKGGAAPAPAPASARPTSAAANGSTPGTGMGGTPDAIKMPALQKGHTPAGMSGKSSLRDTPTQAAKTPVQVSWIGSPDNLVHN